MTPVAEDDGGGLNSPTTNSTSISTTTTTTDEDQQQVKKKMDDSFKLTQDASKIVRAIKRLNVPSNSSVVETIDSENGKRGIIRLKQGVHLSYSVDLVEDGDGKTVPQKMDDKENATCVSAGERKSVKLNQVIQNCETNNKVCKTTSTMTMAVVCKDGGGGGESEGDKEPCQEDDVEEWQIVDEVHTDSSTSSDRSLIENQTSKSSISSSSSTTSTTTSLATVVPNSVKEVTARLVNDASATCLQKHQSSIKPNDKIETESPLFDANSNEEAMQWGVSKVVDDILENLPNIDNDFDVSEKSNSRKTPIEEGRQRLISSLESVQSNKMAADGCCSVVGGRGGAKRKSESDGEDKSLVVKKVRLDSDAKSEESPIKSPMETVSKMSKQLTKRDLEEFIAKEIVAFLSDEHRNEIAELKARIVKLEKAKDYWKRQATAIQKQHVEDDIAIQRLSQSLKRTGALPPTKIVTRSVGLQVQTQVPSVLRCNRMVPSELALADVKKSTPTATTTTTTTVRGASNTTTTNTPTPPQLSTMKLKSSSMPAPKPNVSLLSISKPPQAGYQSPVSKPAILMSPRPRLSPVTSLPNPNISILTQQPSTSAQNSTSATTNAKLPPSVSVSILQQRITNPPGPSSAPPNLMVTPVSMPMSIVPKVASVIPPQSSPARTILEVKRGLPSLPTASSMQPVPTRLIPNQAAAKNVTAVCSTAPLPVPIPSPTSVKIIDLTADEEEANAQQKKAQNQQLLPQSIQGFSGATLIPIKNTPTMPTAPRPVTILAAPVSQPHLPTPIILGTPPTPGTTPQALRLSSSNIRQIPPPLVSQPMLTPVTTGSRYTYLLPVPTSNSVAVMRHAQPIFVASQARSMQQVSSPRNLTPPIQTILLQRGTTLLPVTTTGAVLAPVSSIGITVPQSALKSSTTITTIRAAAPLPVNPQTVATPVPRPPQVTPMLVKPPITTNQPVNNQLSTPNVNSTNQAIVVSRVTPKHPAPLPTSIVYNDNQHKAIPPKPALKISKVNDGIVLSWNMMLNTLHAEIAFYQLYAYQESSAPPSTSLWKKIGDVKALALPMACTLTQFVDGHKYHFAVRAMDVHNRTGPFSDAGSIVLHSTASVSPASTSSTSGTTSSAGIRV